MIIDELEDRIARTDDRIDRAKKAIVDGDPKFRRFVRSGQSAFRKQRLKQLQKLLRQRPIRP